MPRAVLSRTAIVDAAFDQLAEGGLESITARALAQRLGVQAGALYYHLADMTALRDEMASRIVARMLAGAGGEPGVDWRTLLRTIAHRVRSLLLEYRDGARVVSGTLLTDDDALRALEAPLAALVADGFTPLDAQRALATVNAFVIGYVIEEQQRLAQGTRRYTAEQRRARLDPDAQPLSYALSAEVVDLPEQAFEWGVEALVAGIGAHAAR
ncbi:MAG: TetR/AcrR family transcriptional regulator C-terminal domain-containing protein [Actinobacteria bacterium]|nr:TetR/AcrR family transcriptional regulator C-terminal domain-containing protein [Actinomycetota bacterium]